MGISYYIPALSRAYHDAGGDALMGHNHCMMSELCFYFNLFHALFFEIDPINYFFCNI